MINLFCLALISMKNAMFMVVKLVRSITHYLVKLVKAKAMKVLTV